MQLLIKLIFVLNNTLNIWLHQGEYLSIYNTYEVEISPHLVQGIFQAIIKISHS